MNYETEKFIREYFDARPQLEPPVFRGIAGYEITLASLHMIESLLNERHELREWQRKNRSAIARASNAEEARKEGRCIRFYPQGAPSVQGDLVHDGPKRDG